VHVSKLLVPDILKALENEPDQLAEELAEVLAELHIEDLAEIIAELPQNRVVQLLEVLPLDLAADVLSRLPGQVGSDALEQLDPPQAARVLLSIAPDDRTDLVQELPESARETILDHIEAREPEVAEEVRTLAAYGADTAGGIMTTAYIAIAPELAAGNAIGEVRRIAREQHLEVIYNLYVVAYDVLLGVLSLRDIILAGPDQPVSEVMTSNVVRVLASEDQEEVAKTMAKYDLSAIPVVDDAGRMLGVVTIDDVVDVMVEEATEDAQKAGAVVPIDASYFQTGFVSFVKSRITWLVVLFIGELATATVMQSYEHQLAAVIDLVIFVPLIISSGGNSGSQSSSLLIRALALGEVTPRDWPRVFWREASIGLALGTMLGVVGFVRAYAGTAMSTHAGPSAMAMGMTVALSVVAVVMLGTLVGSLMPLAIRRLGLDPAVSSTPFVASLVDVFGLVVYFSLARFLLSLS
jgi:magnesium transporter